MAGEEPHQTSGCKSTKQSKTTARRLLPSFCPLGGLRVDPGGVSRGSSVSLVGRAEGVSSPGAKQTEGLRGLSQPPEEVRERPAALFPGDDVIWHHSPGVTCRVGSCETSLATQTYFCPQAGKQAGKLTTAPPRRPFQTHNRHAERLLRFQMLPDPFRGRGAGRGERGRNGFSRKSPSSPLGLVLKHVLKTGHL